jgi:hypothetical protein
VLASVHAERLNIRLFVCASAAAFLAACVIYACGASHCSRLPTCTFIFAFCTIPTALLVCLLHLHAVIVLCPITFVVNECDRMRGKQQCFVFLRCALACLPAFVVVSKSEGSSLSACMHCFSVRLPMLALLFLYCCLFVNACMICASNQTDIGLIQQSVHLLLNTPTYKPAAQPVNQPLSLPANSNTTTPSCSPFAR